MGVIVTGAKGFVGREIVAELVENYKFVCEVGRTENSQEIVNQTNKHREFRKADITDIHSFSSLENLQNIQAVIHSAGLAHQFGEIEKEKFYNVNVLGTKNITELAVRLKVEQFILISSTAVYGIKKSKKSEDRTIVDEFSYCKPETLYAESKLEAEKVCIEICRRDNLPLTILRLAPVIGENNAGNAARLISAIDRKRFFWIGNGENLKTLIYKRDVAKAVLKVLQNKKEGIEIFNLASSPISMKDFVGEIEKQLNVNVPKIYFPPFLLQTIFTLNDKTAGLAKIRKIAGTIEKWLSDDIYSAENIKEKYNFTPQTSMAEAIEKQVKCYLDGKNKGQSVW